MISTMSFTTLPESKKYPGPLPLFLPLPPSSSKHFLATISLRARYSATSWRRSKLGTSFGENSVHSSTLKQRANGSDWPVPRGSNPTRSYSGPTRLAMSDPKPEMPSVPEPPGPPYMSPVSTTELSYMESEHTGLNMIIPLYLDGSRSVAGYTWTAMVALAPFLFLWSSGTRRRPHWKPSKQSVMFLRFVVGLS